jgi:SAM-dependent methyltransferase
MTRFEAEHSAGAATADPSRANAPESDGTGYTIENRLGGTAAPHYRKWQIDMVRPHCGRLVLELGPGMGHFAAELDALDLDRLVLADTEEYALEHLRRVFADRDDVDVVKLEVPGPVNIGDPVDTIIAMNVIEHIDDDTGALRDLATALVPGGRVVIWVPGYPQLYGEFDRKVGHVRRHTPTTLREHVSRAGLDVEVCRPVNLFGALAWWVAVRRGGVGYPKPWLVWLYDSVGIPVTRLLERIVRPPFGQTVFCVASKPGRVPERVPNSAEPS